MMRLGLNAVHIEVNSNLGFSKAKYVCLTFISHKRPPLLQLFICCDKQ